MALTATASVSGAIPDVGPVYAGALQQVSLNCAALLASGETVGSVVAGVNAWAHSPVADANASELLRGSASVSGSNVSAFVGGIASTTNFLAGAVYTLWFQLTTSLGNTPIVAVNISVSAITPPTLGSGASLPLSEFNETGNFTPAAPGIYYVGAAAVCAIPASSVGGDILIVNKSSSATVTFSGAALNYSTLPVLSPGASLTLHWSPLENGFVIV